MITINIEPLANSKSNQKTKCWVRLGRGIGVNLNPFMNLDSANDIAAVILPLGGSSAPCADGHKRHLVVSLNKTTDQSN